MSSWAIVLIRYRCSFMLTNCSHFSPFRAATMATDMHGLNFTLKSWAESLGLIMHGPYQPLCVILTVCEQPPLSVVVRRCHVCINLSCLCAGFLSCQTLHWSSLSLTELAKDVHFLFAHKATSKHTHNASPTSEGLTQARPIEHMLQFSWQHHCGLEFRVPRICYKWGLQ